MLRMMEVVGTSPAGFDEAVRAAVEEIIRAGHKAHFFQVVEERGSIRDGRLKEYQVILKVAVESDDGIA
jgi:flavin-binding protein dodecin